ncbi:MAG: hypothetical protein QXM43_09055, partial [Desulfurococcaceae archaeon]
LPHLLSPALHRRITPNNIDLVKIKTVVICSKHSRETYKNLYKPNTLGQLRTPRGFLLDSADLCNVFLELLLLVAFNSLCCILIMGVRSKLTSELFLRLVPS